MKRIVSLSILTSLLFQQSVQAATVLPMLYLPDNVSLNLPSPDSQLLLGAFPTQDAEGNIKLNTSKTIFVAPQTASVREAKGSIYPNAQCSVVNKVLGDEKLVQDLLSEHRALVAEYWEETKKYSVISREAKKACVEKSTTADLSPDDAQKELEAESACKRKTRISETVAELSTELKGWREELTALKDDYYANRALFGSEAGGYADATLQLFNPDEIKKVKEANKDYAVQVIPFKKVNFAFTTSEESIEGYSGVKTVLGFSLAGETLRPEGGSAEALSKVKTGTNVAMGLTLSRIGACNKSMRRAATFNYDYDAFAFIRGSAMVNRWKVYEKAVKNKSEGGIFRTSTVHDLNEDLQEGSVHSVLIEGVPDKDFSAAQEQLSAQVLDDMIKEIATPENIPATKEEVAGLPMPTADGATVAADALAKCPHIYCQAGSFILKGAQAIFGEQASDSTLKRKFDKKVKREYAYTTKIEAHGSASTSVEWILNP